MEIRVGRDNVRHSEESIQYLESARNGTDIHTAGGLLHTSMPTGLLEQKLGKDFLKIQRGLIVNMHFIEKNDGGVLRSEKRFYRPVKPQGQAEDPHGLPGIYL